MTLGNLAALRQTNIVRMLAYSSIAQGGFMLVPFAAAGIAGATATASRGVVEARRHLPADLRRDEPRCLRGRHRGRAPHPHRPRSRRYGGLVQTSPGLAVLMTIFMVSLAGIPPLAGWFAKFVMFRSISTRARRRRIVLGGDRRGQLGDRVLLLLRRRARDVVPPEPADGIDRSPMRIPLALDAARSRSCARDRASSSASTRSCSPGSASSPPAASRWRRRGDRATGSTGARADPVRPRSSRPRCTSPRPASSPPATAPGRAGRRLRHQPRGRVRCSARASRGRSTRGGTSSASPTRSSWSRPAPATAGSRARCCAPSPTCAAALRYVLVERSAALRARAARAPRARTVRRRARPVRAPTATTTRRCRSPGAARSSPRSTSCPALAVDGVVLANELLDNLPFGIVERTADGWHEVRVGVATTAAFAEVLGAAPADDDRRRWLDGRRRRRSARGSRCRAAIDEWIDDCAPRAAPRRRAARSTTSPSVDELARAAPAAGCARTAAHERGADPLDAPGHAGHHRRRRCSRRCAATRARAGFTIARESTQAEWLRDARHRRARRRGPARRGRRARTSATSRRSPAAAGSPRPPRSPIPPASAPTASSSLTTELVTPADAHRRAG